MVRYGYVGIVKSNKLLDILAFLSIILFIFIPFLDNVHSEYIHMML
jgi:hypothetical protein